MNEAHALRFLRVLLFLLIGNLIGSLPFHCIKWGASCFWAVINTIHEKQYHVDRS